MTDKALQVFDFKGSRVRVVMVNDEPWWVAKDVCDVLELSNPSQAIAELEGDERNTLSINEGNKGNPTRAVVSEPGLYSLILRSRKSEAREFKRWITHDVIPAIRKHGGYLTPAKLEEALLNPDTLIRLATELKEERTKRQELEAQAKRDAPKVLFADSVSGSCTDILIGDLAKLLRQNGVNIGQKRLFAWLRDNGYLIKQKGLSWNMPSQMAMELSLSG